MHPCWGQSHRQIPELICGFNNSNEESLHVIIVCTHIISLGRFIISSSYSWVAETTESMGLWCIMSGYCVVNRIQSELLDWSNKVSTDRSACPDLKRLVSTAQRWNTHSVHSASLITSTQFCSGHTTYVKIITVHSLRSLLWQARFDGVLNICYRYHLQNYDIMAVYKCAHLYILFMYLFNTEAYTALSCSKGGSHDRKCCCQSSQCFVNVIQTQPHVWESYLGSSVCSLFILKSTSFVNSASYLRIIPQLLSMCKTPL